MRRIAALTLLTALALPMGACAFGGQASRDAGATGGELRFALGSEIATLSVFQEAGIANYRLASLWQEGLLAINNEGQLEAALAKEWSTEDNVTWVFQLREDAKFHDGTKVTAEDVVFSLETATNPELAPGVSTYWPAGLVVTAEASGPDEVTIVLDGPRPDFGTQVSASGGLLVTSRAFWEQAQDFGSPQDLVLGTGPYKVTEFDPTSHVSFERFDGYWGANAGPERVRVDFIADDATRLLAFQEGEVDVSLAVPPDQAAQWEATGADVIYVSDRSYQGLTFDPTVAPFDDPHVRKAVAHAIDKEAIVDGILKGRAQVATGIDSPVQLAGWVGLERAQQAVAELPAVSFSLADAKAELAKSKVPGGFEAQLTYPSGYSAVGKASLALAQSVQEIGIKLDVREIPLEQWLNEVGDGQHGIAWMIYGPTTPEPNEVTSWLLAADGPGANPANWTDATVATLTGGIAAEPDAEARFEAVLEATSIALEQVIYAPVYWGEAAIATRAGLEAPGFGPYTFSTNWVQAFDSP